MQEKIWEGKLDLIEYSQPSSSSLVPNQPSNSFVKAKFVRDTKVLDDLRKGLGRIEFWDIVKIENVAPKEECGTFDRSNLQVLRMKHFKSKMDVVSITMAGKNRAWIADSDCDTMYLYDDKGKVVKSVAVEEDVCIRDTVVTSTVEITVTNNDKKVRRVAVDGTLTTLIDIAPLNPWGLCLTDIGYIVVCIRGKGDENYLAIYTADGRSKVSEVRGSDAINKRIMTNPYRVIQNGKDFCVVNMDQNIVCVTQGGDLRWIYDGQSAGLKAPFFPRGLCCDKYHNLLVSDFRNNCVHYIDGEGQLIQVMLTGDQLGLKRHWGIGVDDETDQVWVGNLGNDVVIAKYIK